MLQVSDELIVDLAVLKIRSLDEGKGYICDGFPATVEQVGIRIYACTPYICA